MLDRKSLQLGFREGYPVCVKESVNKAIADN